MFSSWTKGANFLINSCSFRLETINLLLDRLKSKQSLIIFNEYEINKICSCLFLSDILAHHLFNSMISLLYISRIQLEKWLKRFSSSVPPSTSCLSCPRFRSVISCSSLNASWLIRSLSKYFSISCLENFFIFIFWSLE